MSKYSSSSDCFFFNNIHILWYVLNLILCIYFFIYYIECNSDVILCLQNNNNLYSPVTCHTNITYCLKLCLKQTRDQ